MELILFWLVEAIEEPVVEENLEEPTEEEAVQAEAPEEEEGLEETLGKDDENVVQLNQSAEKGLRIKLHQLTKL